MDLLDIVLGGLAETDKEGYEYRVNLHCVVNPALQIPDLVRQNNPNQITFTLANNLSQSLVYDYDTKSLTFYTTFGGVPSTVVVPAPNIGAITTDDGFVMSFGQLRNEEPAKPAPVVEEAPAMQQIVPQSETKSVVNVVKPKPLYKLRHLSLVVDNT